MNKKIIYSLVLLLFLLNLGNSLKEEDFIEIYSHKEQYFSLNEKFESYFKMKTSFSDSDLVIKFSTRNGYTIEILFFNSIEEIVYDEQTKEYTGFIKQIPLEGEQEFHFSESTSQKESKYYYIIIRDIKQLYHFKSYLEIFNEKDPFTLSSEEPLVIPRFYQAQELSFEFNKSENKELNLIIKNENENNTHTLKLEKIYDGIIQEIFTKTDSEINYIIAKEDSGKYKVTIISDKEAYLDTQKIIAIYERDNELIKLKEGEDTTFKLIEGNNLKYIFDLEKYQLGEENLIMLDLDYNMTSMFKDIYGKVINLDENADLEQIISSFPTTKEESEISVFISGNTDYLYEIYFKRNLQKEEGKKTYLFLYADLSNNPATFFYPRKISLNLPNQIEIIDLSTTEDKTVTKTLNAEYERPAIVKFKIPEDRPIFIQHSSEFEGSLLSGNLLTEQKERQSIIEYEGSLFATSNKVEKYNLITFKLFGTKTSAFVKANSPSQFLFFEEELLDRKNISIKDCSIPFYVIEKYKDEDLLYKRHYYLEQVFGKFSFYFKSVWDSLALTEEDDILPITDKDKIKGTYINTGDKLRIFGLKCTVPGKAYINGFDNLDFSHYPGITIVNLLSQGKKEYSLPSKGENYTAHISFENPDSTKVLIERLGQVYELNSTNTSISLDFSIDNSEESRKYSVEYFEDTLLITTINLNDGYFTPITQSETLKAEKVAYKLPKAKDYLKIELNIKNIPVNSFYYDLVKVPGDSYDYLPDPEYSYSSVQEKDKQEFTISYENPYYKYNKNSELNYYIVISFSSQTNELTEYTIEPNLVMKPNYPKLNILTPELINKKEESDIQQFLQIDQIMKDDSKFYVVVHSCDFNEEKELLINNYNEEYKKAKVSNKYQLVEISNNWQDIQFTFDFNNLKINDGAEIFYDEKQIADSLIKKYNDLQLDINGKDKSNKISWTKVDGASNYKIYLLKKEDLNEKEVELFKTNFCYLENLSPKKVEIIDTLETTMDLGSNDRDGEYLVNIIAQVKEANLPFKLIYNSLDINLTEESDDKGGLKAGWIALIIVAAVLLLGITIVFIIRWKGKQQTSSQELNKNLISNSEEDKNVIS